MSSNTQDAKLAEALLHTKPEDSQQTHVRAQQACKGFLVTLLIVPGILAVLVSFRGIPTSTSVSEPLLFYNVSSNWRPPQHETVSKTKASHQEEYKYYYPSRKRDMHGSSFATYTAPSNFDSGPSWTWKNDLNEQVRHSPLIDNDLNIYITTSTRIRKFTSDGELLWNVQICPTQGNMADSPVLYKGHIIGVTNKWPPIDSNFQPTGFQATVGFSLKMSDGSVSWKQVYQYGRSGDADSMSVFNGTLIFAAKRNGTSDPDKSDLVLAANVTDGSLLWEYVVDEIFWNFTPAYADDGTFLFQGTCGAVFRLSLKGELIYKVGPSPGRSYFCSEAGGALGPNGLYYAQWNQAQDGYGAMLIAFGYDGRLAAYQVSDGALVWERRLERRTANYPAVGMIDGRLTVVASVGDQPMIINIPDQNLYLQQMPTPGYLANGIWAIDATDGSMIWQSEEPLWPQAAAEHDDIALYDPRPAWPPEYVCNPDAQAIPLILGDGTVYGASSHGGWLRAIRDANHNGIIEPSEVQTFNTGVGFLNGPSAAPGLLVAAPCWGDAYVFKS